MQNSVVPPALALKDIINLTARLNNSVPIRQEEQLRVEHVVAAVVVGVRAGVIEGAIGVGQVALRRWRLSVVVVEGVVVVEVGVRVWA